MANREKVFFELFDPQVVQLLKFLELVVRSSLLELVLNLFQIYEKKFTEFLCELQFFDVLFLRYW